MVILMVGVVYRLSHYDGDGKGYDDGDDGEGEGYDYDDDF